MEHSGEKKVKKQYCICAFSVLKAFILSQVLANGTSGRELKAQWEQNFKIIEPMQDFQIKAYLWTVPRSGTEVRALFSELKSVHSCKMV